MTERKMDAAINNGTKTGSTYSGWSNIAKRYISEIPKEDFERDSTSQESPRRRRNRRTGWITCWEETARRGSKGNEGASTVGPKDPQHRSALKASRSTVSSVGGSSGFNCSGSMTSRGAVSRSRVIVIVAVYNYPPCHIFSIQPEPKPPLSTSQSLQRARTRIQYFLSSPILPKTNDPSDLNPPNQGGGLRSDPVMGHLELAWSSLYREELSKRQAELNK
ncbi:hypothetical protein IW261DRAFT_1595353 [Armillaria novae-zelandiae]|uniref:Uncharacterized protein n=1 Tax=Armillaria novae-zelandiae TaxID=153914 RepID=A0AA39P1L0_9AGAR|nr:hypothetical protein IW261DRAFT_1595353 [Armillaria novae-zelandiae]